MATYFVGDLQGCYDELQLLLERVDFILCKINFILWEIL